MRSRYTAYTKENIAYLKETLTADQQKDFSAEETRRWARESEWQGLEIKRVEGGEEDQRGLVEFSARFAVDGQPQVHYEIALFERENGAWKYAGNEEFRGNTVRREEPKIGRNDPCPCGSGKKYKKCCGT